MEPLLKVLHLTVCYESRRARPVAALRGVNFDLGPGQAVGLLGESGCGKTTLGLSLLRLLPRAGRVQGGSVLFRGVNLLALGERELERVRGAEISMVEQEPGMALNPVLRVGDQVAEVLRAHQPLPRERAKAEARALLAQVGLAGESHIDDAYPHQLSGGQRQRVVIARAIACRPALLIADEPTTALDAVTQAELLALLRRLKDRLQLALLLISHSPSVLAQIVERVLVMYTGRAILCRLLLARLSSKTGDIEAARRECQTALDELTGREAPILLYQAHFVIGRIEEAVYNLPEARRHYQAAKNVLEALRNRLPGEELKISFMRNRFEVYENLVNLCLVQGPAPGAREEAWTYMEQAKSRSLLDLISRRVSPVAGEEAAKDDGVHRIRDLREQLNWYYHRIEAEHLAQVPATPRRLSELRESAENCEKEILRALRELRIEEAEVAGVEATEPVSLETLRSLLGPQTTLVEYFRVKDRILAALVTEDGLEIVPVTLVPRVAQLLRMLQFQFSKFRLGSNYLREFHGTLFEATQAHLSDLYTDLVACIRAKLKGRHLVVVPHELLHVVPFHALFDGAQYLIDAFTVSYAPSASIYAQCCRKQANMAGGSLILGVPDPRSPAIYEELQSVAAILPQAKLFLGPDASQKVFREKAPLSRLIHIAGHGFFRQDNPMFSGVRLGDTFITLYDLYSLRLPADQITLSGCSTGLNVVAAGDELIGLTRGLLLAGARSLLLTLWDVNDTSTAQFMKAFYSRLDESPDRASALREAMQDLRERYPHPYYWAPFILVGKVFPSEKTDRHPMRVRERAA